MLDNLIANAIKYSPDGGDIVVTLAHEQAAQPAQAPQGGQHQSTERSAHTEHFQLGGADGTTAGEDAVAIQVRDYGLGIPTDFLPHVFERFSRGRNVVSHLPGTGIGLAGVRQIVEQHGGTVEVQSEETVGSTFTVRLPRVPGAMLSVPLDPQDATGTPVPMGTTDATRTMGKAAQPLPPRGRVLIVEDDALTQAMIREALLDEGYQVFEASNGEAALRVIDAESPDVILLDLCLPVMDGPTFARRYRQTVPAPAPIIVVTAVERPTHDCRHMQAAAVLNKPFIVDELLHLVDRHSLTG